MYIPDIIKPYNTRLSYRYTHLCFLLSDLVVPRGNVVGILTPRSYLFSFIDRGNARDAPGCNKSEHSITASVFVQLSRAPFRIYRRRKGLLSVYVLRARWIAVLLAPVATETWSIFLTSSNKPSSTPLYVNCFRYYSNLDREIRIISACSDFKRMLIRILMEIISLSDRKSG